MRSNPDRRVRPPREFEDYFKPMPAPVTGQPLDGLTAALLLAGMGVLAAVMILGGAL